MKIKQVMIQAVYFIIGVALMSTPFWMSHIWNEESDNLPCYDRHNNIINGIKCTGEENKIMEENFFPIFGIVIIGVIIFCFPLISPYFVEPKM